MNRKYNSMYERLVANSEPEHDGVNACWLWTGSVRAHYPSITVRSPHTKRPVSVAAHRLMLEIIHSALFPFDEAGHSCFNTRCINPTHLEIQTQAHNLSERRGYCEDVEGCWIPTLFPIPDPHPEPYF